MRVPQDHRDGFSPGTLHQATCDDYSWYIVDNGDENVPLNLSICRNLRGNWMAVVSVQVQRSVLQMLKLGAQSRSKCMPLHEDDPTPMQRHPTAH